MSVNDPHDELMQHLRHARQRFAAYVLQAMADAERPGLSHDVGEVAALWAASPHGRPREPAERDKPALWA